jgi:hypothetical protein
MIYQIGEKVRLKTDGKLYTIYGVYDDENISLGIYDYPDTEQDIITNIKDIEKIK